MKADTAILEALYQAAGQFVQNDELARLLRVPAARVNAEVADLEKLGYTIELHPHFGYRLLGTPDRLTADDIKARLGTTSLVGANFIRDRSRLQTAPTRQPTIGSEILVFDETASTNDVVEHLAKSGAREGLVVFAESQTRGRGRHGRAWASPRGKGLWFSVLLRPALPPAAASRITVAASVAVARAIRETCRVDARIKWPNDVIVNDKKLAGILVETRESSLRKNNRVGGTGVPACEPSKHGVRFFQMTRRNLPHWQDPGQIYFVTFRVRKGGLLTEQMRDIVLQACRHWHGQRYHLYAATVMPDHVHLLLWPQPLEATGKPVAQSSLPVGRRTVAENGFHSLSDILHNLKSFTAHEIQRHCGWRGSVWMDESFDRIVRDDAEFMEKWNYIAQNAVKKGLAAAAEDYRWFWYAPEPLGVEPEKRPQAGTPVPPAKRASLPPEQAGTPVPPAKRASLPPEQAGTTAGAGQAPVPPQQCIILGIGIDVNCAVEDFSPDVAKIATSLQIETGRAQDRVALAAQVLAALDECYHVALADFEAVADEWARLGTTLGRQIVVTMAQRRLEGFAHALDGDGALLVRKDDGQIERVLGGDLTVEK